ncbi:hypothetical protein GCM10027590_07190 [Nocardiopsis nanhaiensis]
MPGDAGGGASPQGDSPCGVGECGHARESDGEEGRAGKRGPALGTCFGAKVNLRIRVLMASLSKIYVVKVV